jgi:hypothetical protein
MGAEVDVSGRELAVPLLVDVAVAAVAAAVVEGTTPACLFFCRTRSSTIDEDRSDSSPSSLLSLGRSPPSAW